MIQLLDVIKAKLIIPRYQKLVCILSFNYSIFHINHKYILDTTKDSSKASTGNSIIEKLTETREELGDLESSNISVPKETEILSNSSKLSQNIHKFGKL